MRAESSLGRNLLVAGIVVLLSAGAVSAYTVVLKGGKRIQIPDRFTVTPGVLSYEVASGMSVTLQLAAVDVAETERANNEPAGSFVARIAKSDSNSSTLPFVKGAAIQGVRTVTNRDLERYRLARLENERDYETSRKERGLPSLKELRRRAERESVEAQGFVERRFRELQIENAEQRSAEAERRTEDLERQTEQENDLSSGWFWPGSILIDDTFRGNRRSRLGFNLDFNRRFFPHRPRIFVAPGSNRFGPGHSVGPHSGRH